jgi:MYXO-CTERM domain-containing protein
VRVSAADGAVLDAAPITLSPAQPFAGRASPSAVWNGESFVIVWTESDARIVGARVSGGGQLLDAAPFAISRGPGFPDRPSIAWSGSVHLVAWHDWSGEEHRILGARLGPDAALLDLTDVELATRAWQPAVAAGPRGFLVTWFGTGDAPITRGRRHDRSGLPLGEPFPADPFLRVNSAAATSTVWDGASWLHAVASPDNSGRTTFTATRIRHDGGEMLETVEIGVTTYYSRFAVASIGDGRAAFVFPERVFSPYLLHDSDHLWSRTWRSDLTLPPETPDAGTETTEPQPGGCGCGTSAPAPSRGLALLTAAGLLARRRRRAAR